ncbi:hypothetical protein AB0G87_11185 [Streptomyces asoensis]
MRAQPVQRGEFGQGSDGRTTTESACGPTSAASGRRDGELTGRRM